MLFHKVLMLWKRKTFFLSLFLSFTRSILCFCYGKIILKNTRGTAFLRFFICWSRSPCVTNTLTPTTVNTNEAKTTQIAQWYDSTNNNRSNLLHNNKNCFFFSRKLATFLLHEKDQIFFHIHNNAITVNILQTFFSDVFFTESERWEKKFPSSALEVSFGLDGTSACLILPQVPAQRPRPYLHAAQ